MDGERTIRDLCVFLESRYSRTKDNVTHQFVIRLRPKRYPSEVVNIMQIMYSRMNRLARLYASEINFLSFLDSSEVVFGIQRTVDDNSFRIVYDWYVVGRECLPEVCQLDGIDEHVMYTTEKVSGDVKHLFVCPLERIKKTSFSIEDERNIVRYLNDHGYLLLRLEDGDDSTISKSVFKDTLEDCNQIQERIIHCCRYYVGNKKKNTRLLYLKILGYLTEQGDIVCDCESQAQPVGDEQGGTTCIGQIECSTCIHNRNRLTKRKGDGSLIMNWWRKGV